MTRDEYKQWCDEHIDNRPEGVDTVSPEIVQLVNAKLQEIVGNRKIDYVVADWKDTQSLFEDVNKAASLMPGCKFYFFEPFHEALHGGSDDRVVLLSSVELTDDEAEIIFDLIHNLGAEMPDWA